MGRTPNKIKIVEKDILEATEDIIVQPVNCIGSIQTDLGKRIAAKWPAVEKAYHQLFDMTPHHMYLLGQCQFVEADPSNGKERPFVANLFTQYVYDKDQRTIWAALRSAIDTLLVYAETHDFSIAIPYGLGSDCADADWYDVLEMININAEYSVDVKPYHDMITIYKSEGDDSNVR